MQSEVGSKWNYGKLNIIILIFVNIFYLLFYIQYAFRGWFYEDDFSFLREYARSYYFIDLIEISHNFGRFISRNFYWHTLQLVSGYHSEVYFLINLGFILATTALIYRLLYHLTKRSYFSLCGASFYLISTPTVYNYIWISNSQHIIAHFFIFLFLYLAIIWDVFSSGNIIKKLITAGVFILGIYTNVLTIFALPPLLFYGFITKRLTLKSSLSTILYVLILLSGSAIFVLFIAQHTDSVYQTHISWTVFKQNVIFYHKTMLFFCLNAAFILIASYQYYRYRDPVLAFFIIASVSFYLPFAFLQYQHYVNYIALAELFLALSLFYLIKNYSWLILGVILVQVICALHILAHLYANPWGASVRSFVLEVKNLRLSNNKNICVMPNVINSESTPDFWWKLGSGQALQIFVNPTQNYILILDNITHYDCPILIVDRHLNLVKIVNNNK